MFIMEESNSDFIDSDTEASMYSQLHHDFQISSTYYDNPIHNEDDFLNLSEKETTTHVKRNVTNNISKPYNFASKNKTLEITEIADQVSKRATFVVAEMARAHSPKFNTSISSTTLLRNELVIPISGETNKESLSKVPTVPKSSKICKPVIRISFDEELKAEKQNRRQPLVPELTGLSKHVKVKDRLIRRHTKKKAHSGDSSDSSGEGKWPKYERSNVVINVGPSSIGSDEFEVDNVDVSSMGEVVTQELQSQVHKKKDGKMYLECYNCRERGHLSKACKKPKRTVNCFLCGQPGHKGSKCPNPICNRCLLPGHWHYECRWSPKQAPPCRLCHSKGHLCQLCPNNWRRYHLTTTDGPLVTVYKYNQIPQHQTCYCYICGCEGHYGYNCQRNKKNNSVFPVNRVVSDYSDPRKVLLDRVSTKLWRKMLKLAAKVSSEEVSMPAKRVKPMQQLKNTKKKRKKKKVNVQSASGRGDIVRINPITEASFPRSKKKIKKKAGLLAPLWKEVRRKGTKNRLT